MNPFHTGIEVIVTQLGPWEGRRGVIAECRESRAVVKMEAFERQVEVEFAYEELLPNEPPEAVLVPTR